MSRPIVVLLVFVMIALLADVTIRALPVHAQGSTMVYIDVAHDMGKQGVQLATKGTEVVAFSCANRYGRGGGVDCYVLSK